LNKLFQLLIDFLKLPAIELFITQVLDVEPPGRCEQCLGVGDVTDSQTEIMKGNFLLSAMVGYLQKWCS